MRLVKVQEPIRVVHASGSYVPQTFTWRAREHRVWKVEAVKDESIDRADGPLKRRIFQIRTHSGMQCSISFSELRKRWRLETIHPKGGVA